MSDPHTVPARLIGADSVKALHNAGYRIVPTIPTPRMVRAAAQRLEVIKSGNGGKWLDYSQHDKARIRYAAMLTAWNIDFNGFSTSCSSPKPDRRSFRRRMIGKAIRQYHLIKRRFPFCGEN